MPDSKTRRSMRNHPNPTSSPTPTPGPRYCAVRRPKAPKLRPGLDPARKRLILETRDKWMNGTTLRYWFFDKPARWAGGKAQQDVVRRAFRDWKELDIGLDFVEVTKQAEADIRIAFEDGDGSWSYVGTDIRTKRPDPRTMNFGWSLTEDPQEGLDTARHEIGHTLGLPHEHQNPFAGIVWNEEAVYKSLAQPPNRWSRATTFSNILEKLGADKVQGSSWDPDSVMHYPFDPGLILEPAKYRNGLSPAGGLSPRDKTWIRTFYPPRTAAAAPKLTPFNTQALSLAPGQQADFTFQPPDSREYEFRTFGAADTVMALYEGDGQSKPLAEDDDSGAERNASFKVRLQAGRSYRVSVRLRYAKAQGDTTVMVW